MTTRRRPDGIEWALAGAALLAAFAATQLAWATVGAACANTGVTLGFVEGDADSAWPWLYILAFPAAAAAILVAGRTGTALAVAAPGLAALATWQVAAELLAPFEARSAPGTGVLCGMDLAAGGWLAVAGVALAIALAGRRVVRP